MESVWADLTAFKRAVARHRTALRWDRIRILTSREIDVHVYDQAMQLYSVASYPSRQLNR